MGKRPATSPMRGVLSPRGQAFALGGTAFLAGWIFPALREYGSNIAPLLGFIFFLPIGLAAGLVIGHLAHALRLSPGAAAAVLIAACFLAAGGIWMLYEPEDRWESDLVYGSVEECTPQEAMLTEVIASWERSIEINPDKNVLSTWREDVARTLRESPVAVADFAVQAKRPIFVSRHSDNRGARYAGAWQPQRTSNRYLIARGLCASTIGGKPDVFWTHFPDGQPSEEHYPPRDAEFLMFPLRLLETVPDEYRKWAS